MAEAAPKQKWDYLLLLAVLCLAALGLVMLLSASSVLAKKWYGDPYYFFFPQVAYVLLGLAVMICLKNVPYRLFCRLSYLLLFLALAGLALVFVPGIGRTAGGATRWLSLGGFSFQPSELTKVVLVVYLAYSLASKREYIRNFSRGLLPPLLVLGTLILLVMAEPDLGASVVLVLLAVIMFFISGVRLTYLFSLGLLFVPALYWAIIQNPYRLRRISAFLSPWADPLDTGYHIIHSFMAFSSGGLAGMGPGGGRQKLFFLPEPHTDFIFAVVGEELGFVGVTFVALLFLVVVWRGISIALNAYELEGAYLAMGLTMIIGLQAFMNMAVVVGLLPTKGMTLPFFSYGGSSMIVNFAAVGMLMNIALRGKPANPPERKEG